MFSKTRPAISFSSGPAGLARGASAVFVVSDGNGTACIMADFAAAFEISYDSRSGAKVGTAGLARRVGGGWLAWPGLFRGSQRTWPVFSWAFSPFSSGRPLAASGWHLVLVPR